MEPQEYTLEDGTVIKAVPVEVAEEYKSALDKANEDLVAKGQEVENLKRVNAEKTMNFQKYNELTEEQKKAYNQNEVELLRRGDLLEEKLTQTTQELEAMKNQSKAEKKASVMRSIHQGNAELEKVLDENYNKLNMPDGTPEEIAARARAAAALSGITVDPRNPLFIPIDGEAPTFKEGKEYVDTPEGNTAADMVRGAMGIKKPNA